MPKIVRGMSGLPAAGLPSILQMVAMIECVLSSKEVNTTTIQSLTQRAQILGQAVDRWNTVMLWALGFAAFAALAVVVATGVVLSLTKQLGTTQEALLKAKDQQLARELSDKDLKIAETGKGASEAQKGTALAQADAARANQQAAEANKKAEEERVKRLELEASLKPRRLSAEQQGRLSAALTLFGRTPINLAWSGPGGTESADLASDIYNAIINAGATVPVKNILMDQYFKGVFLKAGTGRMQEAEAIAQFLIEAGLSTKPVPLQPVPDAQELTINIGSKP